MSNFDGMLVHRSVVVAICCGGCYKVTFMGACVVGMVSVTCWVHNEGLSLLSAQELIRYMLKRISPFQNGSARMRMLMDSARHKNHTHHTGTHKGHFVTSTTTDSNNYWPVNERMMEIGRSTLNLFMTYTRVHTSVFVATCRVRGLKEASKGTDWVGMVYLGWI